MLHTAGPVSVSAGHRWLNYAEHSMCYHHVSTFFELSSQVAVSFVSLHLFPTSLTIHCHLSVIDFYSSYS